MSFSGAAHGLLPYFMFFLVFLSNVQVDLMYFKPHVE